MPSRPGQPGSSRSHASLLAHGFAASLLVATGGALVPAIVAGAAPGTGEVVVRIVAQGEAIPGVPVQVRSTGQPGLETWIEDPTALVDTSDTEGVVRFRGVAPGRYHVVGHCGRLPDDCIAGSIATKVDVLPGATVRTTLTLRRGGRILGRTLVGERGVGGVTLQTESTDALPSTCPMLEPRNPGPDGTFTVGKVPIGTFVWVKALKPLGRGDLQVWKDFNLAHAETVTGTWNFPELDSARLGTVRIGVRLEGGGAADRGRLELLHLDPAGWRYAVGFDFTEAESLTVLPSLPPGDYTVRAMATPGVKAWWNATADTLTVAPGVERTKIVSARLLRP